MTLDEMEARIRVLEESYTVILTSLEKMHSGMIETDALLLKSLQAQRRVTELLAAMHMQGEPGDWQ